MGMHETTGYCDQTHESSEWSDRAERAGLRIDWAASCRLALVVVAGDEHRLDGRQLGVGAVDVRVRGVGVAGHRGVVGQHGVDAVYVGGKAVANVSAGAPSVPLPAIDTVVGVRSGGAVLGWRIFYVDGLEGGGVTVCDCDSGVWHALWGPSARTFMASTTATSCPSSSAGLTRSAGPISTCSKMPSTTASPGASRPSSTATTASVIGISTPACRARASTIGAVAGTAVGAAAGARRSLTSKAVISAMVSSFSLKWSRGPEGPLWEFVAIRAESPDRKNRP